MAQKANNLQKIAELEDQLEAACFALKQREGSVAFKIGQLVLQLFTRQTGVVQSFKNALSLILEARIVVAQSRLLAALFTGLPVSFVKPDMPSGMKIPSVGGKMNKSLLSACQNYLTREQIELIDTNEDPFMTRAKNHALDIIMTMNMALPQNKQADEISSGGPYRILYVVKSDIGNSTNGYSTRSHELLLALNSLGLDVEALVVPDPDGNNVRAGVFKQDGVVYHRLLKPQMTSDAISIDDYFQQRSQSILNFARDHRATLIHATSNYVNAIPALMAARKMGVPFVYELRGLWELTRITVDPRFEQSLGCKFQSTMESKCANTADAVCAIGQPIIDILHSREAQMDLTELVPNGVRAPKSANSTVTKASRKKAKSNLGLSPAPVIGYIGSMSSYEGLDLILRAAKILRQTVPDLQVLFVGDGLAKSALKALADQRDNGNVLFTGNLSQQQARDSLHALDIFICPREDTVVTRTVSPLKHLEAMAAGVPVIASDLIPLHVEEADHNLISYFGAGDAEGLTKMISLRLTNNRSVSQKELNRSVKNFIAQKTWKATASNIDRLYQKIP